LVAGLDLGSGPTWQLLELGDDIVTVMHPLLTGPDNVILQPSLGRGLATDPWPAKRERIGPVVRSDGGPRKPSTGPNIASLRSARGLEAKHHVGAQMMLAHGETPQGEEYVFALTRDMVLGRLGSYIHRVGSDHWSYNPDPAHARQLYQKWPSSLLDKHNGAENAHPLSTAAFDQDLRGRLNRVMATAVHKAGTTGLRRIEVSDAEAIPQWLRPCDERSDEALSNGIEPMLEAYLQSTAHDSTPSWVRLSHLIDDLADLPQSPETEVTGQLWSPYGNHRVIAIDELFRTLPRRAAAPESSLKVAEQLAQLDTPARTLARLPTPSDRFKGRFAEQPRPTIGGRTPRTAR
jgi:hypothetical protein